MIKLEAKLIAKDNFTFFTDKSITMNVLEELSKKRLRGCLILNVNGNLIGYMPERRFIFSNEGTTEYFGKPISVFQQDFLKIPTVAEDTLIEEVLKKLQNLPSTWSWS